MKYNLVVTQELAWWKEELSKGIELVVALEKEKAYLLKRDGFLERAIKSNDNEAEVEKENKKKSKTRKKQRFLNSQS